MFYYCSYSNGRRYVRAYDDEKHGAPRFAGKIMFLFHNSVCGSADNLYKTEREALKGWNEWSEKPVVMPDGREVVPAVYFGHYNAADSVFIPWTCVQGEKWPGEY